MGRVQDKLEELIEAEGFQVDGIYGASGYWRQADVYRWECTARTRGRKGFADGISCCIDCWDTMTDCVRYGIEIVQDRGMHFDAHAKK